MGSFLLKGKKRVLWRGFKGSAIFGLGFCTHNVLTIYPNEVSKKAQQYLAEANSIKEECRARLDELKELRKKLDHVLQIYSARVAKVEELKRKELKKAEPVETCCESHEESVWGFK